MKNNITRFIAGAGLTVATILTMSAPAFAADVLTRQLDQGMTGSDVGSLQSFLAKDPTIYPQGLVTSYFGTLTTSAVSNFQARNGIPTVGRVGPVTLVALNAKMAGGVTTGTTRAPSITNTSVNTSRNGANVYWNTDENAKGVVYYSSSPLVTYERENSVDVSGMTAMTDNNFRTTQNVVLTGLTANTVYYFMVYTTDQDGNVSVTYPTSFQTTN